MYLWAVFKILPKKGTTHIGPVRTESDRKLTPPLPPSRVPPAHGGATLHWAASHLGLRLLGRPVCPLQVGLLPDQRQQVLQQG